MKKNNADKKTRDKRLLASADNVIDPNEDIFEKNRNAPKIKKTSKTKLLESSVPLEPRVAKKKPKKVKKTSKVKIIASREDLVPRVFKKKPKTQKFLLATTAPKPATVSKESFAKEVAKHVITEESMKNKIAQQKAELKKRLDNFTGTTDDDSQVKENKPTLLSKFKSFLAKGSPMS